MKNKNKGVVTWLGMQYYFQQRRERMLNGYYTRKINEEIREVMQKICNHECEDCPWYIGKEK